MTIKVLGVFPLLLGLVLIVCSVLILPLPIDRVKFARDQFALDSLTSNQLAIDL
jgi:hypothetical protein